MAFLIKPQNWSSRAKAVFPVRPDFANGDEKLVVHSGEAGIRVLCA